MTQAIIFIYESCTINIESLSAVDLPRLPQIGQPDGQRPSQDSGSAGADPEGVRKEQRCDRPVVDPQSEASVSMS